MDFDEHIVHAFVTTKLDYCNSLLHRIPSREIEKLKRLQNTAARPTVCMKKTDHITPVLKKLPWLPVNDRIIFKLLLLTYKSFKDIRDNGFCASLLRTQANSHATSCIERALIQVLKRTMTGQMAIAIALLGLNDLGRPVTPTSLFRNRFYLQLCPYCPKMDTKLMWEVKKNSPFLSVRHRILPPPVD